MGAISLAFLQTLSGNSLSQSACSVFSWLWNKFMLVYALMMSFDVACISHTKVLWSQGFRKKHSMPLWMLDWWCSSWDCRLHQLFCCPIHVLCSFCARFSAMDYTSHTFLPAQHTFQSTCSHRKVWSLLCWFCCQCPWLCSLALWFKELSPLWGVFEKQPNFYHAAKHVYKFLNILTRMTKEPDLNHGCCNESTWHVILHNPWCDH